MDLDVYNRSFEEIVEVCDDEADLRLRQIRQQCVHDFINRITERQQEWESAFNDILRKSQENDLEQSQQKAQSEARKTVTFSKTTTVFNFNDTNGNNTLFQLTLDKPVQEPEKLKDDNSKAPTESKEKPVEADKSSAIKEPEKSSTSDSRPEPAKSPVKDDDGDDFGDPQFSNISLVKEHIRVQQVLENARQSCSEIASNPSLKAFKNDINLFVRTQINSISNSDHQHLETKMSLLVTLFLGRGVNFQNRIVNASQHPQGQLFAMDLAAQTFVTVGTRLVNSVPAIARSMATVINGIIGKDFPIFKDLFIGHLQERCPFLIPMHPKFKDFKQQQNAETNFKIACGYAYDPKTQFLETEEKYLARMRSMILIYACFTIQGHLDHAWSWLVGLLSLKPRPVITATVLQAFLQEASKKLSETYGKQYKKLIEFIKSDYTQLIEEATTPGTERQSLIKLKNLLSDNSNLIAAPSMSSIFGPAR